MRVAILSEAVGGLALAADLALKGHHVTLCGAGPQLDPIAQAGGVTVLDAQDPTPSWAPLQVASDAEAAIRSAELVVVMLPADRHDERIRAISGALNNAQALVLAPGGVGGALLARQIAVRAGAPDLLCAQTAALPLASMLTETGTLRITGRKRSLPLGVYPARRTEEALARLGPLIDNLVPSGNAIENGLSRAAIGLHPLPMLFNAVRIEREGSYRYDGYDITPSVARVIAAVDLERRAILRALGAADASFVEILDAGYGTGSANLYEAVHAVPAYRGVMSPPDLRYRYLSEDVPTQVVPAAELGRALGCATPLLDAIIAFTSALHGCDYAQSGWTLQRLGLNGLTAGEIRHFLAEGAA